MLDTSIIEAKIRKRVADVCFESIVSEAFIAGLPLPEAELTDGLTQRFAAYATECLQDLGSIELLKSALESEKNPVKRNYLQSMYTLCMETATDVTSRILAENKDDKALKEAADNVCLTNSEYSKFSKAAATLTPTTLTNMIQKKTLDVIEAEKEAYQKDQELEQELKDAIVAKPEDEKEPAEDNRDNDTPAEADEIKDESQGDEVESEEIADLGSVAEAPEGLNSDVPRDTKPDDVDGMESILTGNCFTGMKPAMEGLFSKISNTKIQTRDPSSVNVNVTTPATQTVGAGTTRSDDTATAAAPTSDPSIGIQWIDRTESVIVNKSAKTYDILAKTSSREEVREYIETIVSAIMQTERARNYVRLEFMGMYGKDGTPIDCGLITKKNGEYAFINESYMSLFRTIFDRVNQIQLYNGPCYGYYVDFNFKSGKWDLTGYTKAFANPEGMLARIIGFKPQNAGPNGPYSLYGFRIKFGRLVVESDMSGATEGVITIIKNGAKKYGEAWKNYLKGDPEALLKNPDTKKIVDKAMKDANYHGDPVAFCAQLMQASAMAGLTAQQQMQYQQMLATQQQVMQQQQMDMQTAQQMHAMAVNAHHMGMGMGPVMCSAEAFESYMKSIAGENYRAKHASVFSRLQELAYESILGTTEKYTEIPFDTMSLITRQNTFGKFNSHWSKSVESMMDSIGRYAFESAGVPDAPAPVKEEQLNSALLTASIIYTFFETLNSMNLYCPKLAEIKQFVDETLPIESRVELDKTRFTDLFKGILSKAQSAAQKAMTVPEVDAVQGDLDIVRERCAAPGFENMRQEIDARIGQVQESINARRDYLVSKATPKEPVVESATQLMRRERDTMKFSRMASTMAAKPNVGYTKIKIDPQGGSSYVAVECYSADNRIANKTTIVLEGEVPNLPDYVQAAVEGSRLPELHKRVMITDRRSGKVYFDKNWYGR